MSHTLEDYKNVYYIMDFLGRAELVQAYPGDKNGERQVILAFIVVRQWGQSGGVCSRGKCCMD